MSASVISAGQLEVCAVSYEEVLQVAGQWDGTEPMKPLDDICLNISREIFAFCF